jgi:uncharacterized iron-regulated membrane protein
MGMTDSRQAAPSPKSLLKIHLVMGLAAVLFLIILGLTGSIMAFEGDIDRWIHPGFWHVAEGLALAEGDLIAGVDRKFAPLRLQAVEISQQRGLAQSMQLSDHSSAIVNPYGRGSGQTYQPAFIPHHLIDAEPASIPPSSRRTRLSST